MTHATLHRAFLGALAGMLVTATALGLELETFALDRGGVHPTDEDVATDSLRIAFTGANGPARTIVTIHVDDVPLSLLDVQPSDSTLAIELTTTIGETMLTEGAYACSLEITDDATTIRAATTFHVDGTGPVFTSFEVTGPDGSYANGDYVPMRARFDEPVVSVALDATGVDDAGSAANLFVDAIDDTTWGLVYLISPDNTTGDDDALPFLATATDRFGNETTSDPLTICLSTFPPLFESGHLASPTSGDTIPDDTAFTSGDQIVFVTAFQIPSPGGEVIDPVGELTYVRDLTDLDTAFNILSDQMLPDSLAADTLDASEALAPGYAFRVIAHHSYTLSLENRNQEGFYDAVFTASDRGCGESSTSPPFRIRLADLGPPMPTIDPPSESIVRSASITLTGTAPEAKLVRFARESGERLVDAELDTLTARFEATVPLAEGRNRIVAIASDLLEHDSEPSPVLEIFRLERATLTVAPRVRPGDTIEVALLEEAMSVDLDVFNLVGDRIWHERSTASGTVHTFDWDGRSTRGDLAKTGPYIARAIIRTSSGRDVLNEAFVFTRR